MADTNQRGVVFRVVIRVDERGGMNKKASYTRARARTPRKILTPFHFISPPLLTVGRRRVIFLTISMLQLTADTGPTVRGNMLPECVCLSVCVCVWLCVCGC